MSGTTDGAATAVAAPAEPLDRVMLAMDVVDTLRAQQAMVEAELADDERQGAFVQRVRKVYESQGIDVPAGVVEEAVQAMREQRFVYTPPARSFAVRLAEVYVERGKWALRGLLALGVGLAIWAAIALPAYYEARGHEQAFAQRFARVDGNAGTLDGRLAELRTRLDHLRPDATGPGSSRLIASAADELEGAAAAIAALHTTIAEHPTAAEYARDLQRYEPWLGALEDRAAAAESTLSGAAKLLDVAARLQSLRGRLDVVMARLDGVELTPAGRVAIDAMRADVIAALDGGEQEKGMLALRRLDQQIDAVFAARGKQETLRKQFQGLRSALAGVQVDAEPAATRQELLTGIEQAMAADDWDRAGELVDELRELTARLDVAYELRIVTRPGVQSGIWRYHDNSPGNRSYYIVVEAVDPNGRVLQLPITSEEDQTTRRVNMFAVRVPEAVYEKVKADKLDNGIVDATQFGRKRRGSLRDEYLVPVAGGAITRW